jgi:hypothetical protein
MTACSAGQRHFRRRQPRGGPAAPLAATAACFLLLLAGAAGADPPPGTFFCGKKSRKATITSSSYKVVEKTRTVAADGSITYCYDATPNGACGDASAGCCPSAGGPKASRLLVPLDVADCINVPDTREGYMQALKALKQIRTLVGVKAGKVSIKYSLKAEEVALSISLAALPPTGTSAFCITLPPAVINLGCPNLWRVCGDAPCPFAVETKSFVNAAGAKGACCVYGTTSFLIEMPSCEEEVAKVREPCRNEGKCVNNAPGVGGYTCECRLGWAGKFCDDPTADNKCVLQRDPCTAPSGKKGICINDPTVPGGWTCDCQGMLAGGSQCKTHHYACFAMGGKCLRYAGPGRPSIGGCPSNSTLHVERGQCVPACTTPGAVMYQVAQGIHNGICGCPTATLFLTNNMTCIPKDDTVAGGCPSEMVYAINHPTAASHCTYYNLNIYDESQNYPYRVANFSMAFAVAPFGLNQAFNSEEMRVTALWGTEPRPLYWLNHDAPTSFLLRAQKAYLTGRVTYAFAFPSHLLPDFSEVQWFEGGGLFGDAQPARSLSPAGLAATAHFFVKQLARSLGAAVGHPCDGLASCAVRACFDYLKCIGGDQPAEWPYVFSGGSFVPYEPPKEVPPFGFLKQAGVGSGTCIMQAAGNMTKACVVQPSQASGEDWTGLCYNPLCDLLYKPFTCTVPTVANQFCCDVPEGVC